MFNCPKCGGKIGEGDLYCLGCGAKIAGIAKTEEETRGVYAKEPKVKAKRSKTKEKLTGPSCQQ